MISRTTLAKVAATIGCVTGIALIAVGATVASPLLFPGIVIFMIGALGGFVASMERSRRPITTTNVLRAKTPAK